MLNRNSSGNQESNSCFIRDATSCPNRVKLLKQNGRLLLNFAPSRVPKLT
jgi:hypothetical protein